MVFNQTSTRISHVPSPPSQTSLPTPSQPHPLECIVIWIYVPWNSYHRRVGKLSSLLLRQSCVLYLLNVVNSMNEVPWESKQERNEFSLMWPMKGLRRDGICGGIWIKMKDLLDVLGEEVAETQRKTEELERRVRQPLWWTCWVWHVGCLTEPVERERNLPGSRDGGRARTWNWYR